MIFNHIDFLNEGEQAEEYKKRKAEEAAKKKQEEKEREERRYGGLRKDQHSKFVGNKANLKGFDDKSEEEQDKIIDKMSDDERRASASSYVVNKAGLRGRDAEIAFDAINKDRRRHPDRWKADPNMYHDGYKTKRESSIFESVHFI